MNRTFQRWEIPSLGLDKLALQDIAMPSPLPGEIVIEVEAVMNLRPSFIAPTATPRTGARA
ncbi:alcohol dehydrogenase [Pandoraea iniqua]|uniref:hypothetical protein n=1 Tax=Pandoraea iniqua TaxID=2508288 RepID=UPI00123F1AFD|nr:hypothetical protein [Pandoraea iniqua]VVE00044.1 alcohol dehydrogenase [Pandoraea iniqua]